MRRKFSLETLKVRDHSEDLGIDGRLFNGFYGNKVEGFGLDFIWLRIGTSSGLHGNITLGSLEDREFIY
jgi:hypothetical protein